MPGNDKQYAALLRKTTIGFQQYYVLILIEFVSFKFKPLSPCFHANSYCKASVSISESLLSGLKTDHFVSLRELMSEI